MGSSGPPTPSLPSGVTWSSSPCLAAPSTSPILTRGVLCPVLLGTFPGTRAGLSPAAQKLHAQGCAPGRGSLSQKRGLGSLSPVAAAGASHYGQRAGLGRASIVRQATRGTEGGWEGRRAAQRAQGRENVRKEWKGTTLAAPP